MTRFEPGLTRVCISMVTHGCAYRDTCDITRRIAERVRTPISVLVAPPTLKRERLENLRAIGVDMIGVGLDAVTERLFGAIRTQVPAGGLKWDKYWEVMTDARKIFGPWKVNVHTLVGLGETDQDLLRLFVALRDRQIFSYLFCFNPEPDSRDGRPAAALAAALAPGATGQVPDRVRRLRPGTVRLRRRRPACPPGRAVLPSSQPWRTARRS